MLTAVHRTRLPLRPALRAGFTAFLLCWLIGAVQVLPVLSLHQEFGHRHPPDTPFHSHAITLIFQVGTLATIVTGIPQQRYDHACICHYRAPLTRNLALTSFDSRAPPGSASFS